MFLSKKKKKLGAQQKVESEKLKEANIRLEVVAEANRVLVGVVNEQEVFDLITKKLAPLVNMNFPSIWKYDEQSGTIHLKSHSIPKNIKFIAEKAIGKKLSELTFSKKNKEQQKSTYFKVVDQAKPIFSNDLYKHTYPFLNKKVAILLKKVSGMNLAVSVPILVKGKAIGVLSGIWKETHLSQEMETTLYTFANQISIAIYNAKLFQETQDQIADLTRQNTDLKNLYTLVSTVTTSLDPKTVSQLSVNTVTNDSIVIGAFVSEFDPQVGLKVNVMTTNGRTKKIYKNAEFIGDQGFILDPEDPKLRNNFLMRSFLNREVLMSNELDELMTPPLDKKMFSKLVKELNVKSAVAYPLIIRGEIKGVITFLIENMKIEDLDSRHRSQFQTFANQISLAKDNADLYLTSQITQRNLSEALDEIRAIRKRERNMVDIMGHELRTPISVIKNIFSSMDLYQRQKRPIPLDKQLKYKIIGLDAARRESLLIETLLSATKSEGKGFELTIDRVPMDALVEKTMVAHEHEATSKGIYLKYEKPKEPVIVYADLTRSQEIVDNFVSNAVKYTESGGVTIKVEEKDGYGWMHVIDTGVGIAESDLHRLGKKFYRAKKYKGLDVGQGVVRPGGTGLGLYVSFALAKLMDGDYEVESVEHKGSRFSFKLPIYRGEPMSQVQKDFNPYTDDFSHVDLGDDDEPVFSTYKEAIPGEMGLTKIDNDDSDEDDSGVAKIETEEPEKEE